MSGLPDQHSTSAAPAAGSGPPPVHDQALAAAARAANAIRYGDIRLTIHDGRIVQLEVTEKTRFSSN
jgi:hypothetical protein